MATAQSRWDHLNSRRSGVLQRARAAAELTIPSIMPPEGSDVNTELFTPYQSLGARGVNNLASKLLLALLPPGTSFFRFQLDDAVKAALGEGNKEVEEAMRKLENTGMRKVEAGNLRTVLYSVLKHLIVAGNSALHMPAKGDARMFRVNQYVVVRDAQGTVTEAVLKETVSPTTLSDEIKEACEIKQVDSLRDEEGVDIYTIVKLVKGGKTVEYHQEINDKMVPQSEGRNKVEESPYVFLRWTAVDGEDYGRSLVDDYMGDLRSLEGLSKSIIGFSAVASKIILLLHPNSSTDKRALAKANTGDIVTGDIRDIDVLQLEKYADFQVAKSVVDELTLRISHAFLLQSGTVRNAERVTAVEVRAMAQELEDVLGGVYTVLSRELQLPIVHRIMAQMKSAKEFPSIPSVNGKAAVSPIIVTGFDALGRGHELNKFRAYFSDLAGVMGPERVLALFDEEKLAKTFATSHNIDIAELLKTEEQRTAETQQAQSQQLMDKAAGPVAGAVAKGAMESQQ